MYIVTGLKVAKGLKYFNQRASESKAVLKGEGHVTQEAAVEAKLEGELGGENKGKHVCVMYRDQIWDVD